MLRELMVRNLVVLQQVDVEFNKGLVAITGETGAGKTALTDALRLVLGEKARPSMRSDVETWVEGCWDRPSVLPDELTELLPDDATDIVLARKISAASSRAFLSGRGCSTQQLVDIAPFLLRLTGQHAAQQLTTTRAQLDMVDRAVGDSELLQRLADAFQQATLLTKQLQEWQETTEQRQTERRIIEAELKQIRSVDLQEDELEDLEKEQMALAHSQDLSQTLSQAYEALTTEEFGTQSTLGTAISAVEKASQWQPQLAQAAQELTEALDIVQANIQVLSPEVPDDPYRLQVIEDRLAVIHQLDHLGDYHHVLLHQQQLEQRLQEITGGVNDEELQQQADSAWETYQQLDKQVQQLRVTAGTALVAEAQTHLQQLGMAHAVLELQWEQIPPSGKGSWQPTLLLAANPGLPLAPLSSSASGGELSRVFLSLALAITDGDESLLFDEVDAGIGGGMVAEALAKALQRLAEHRQVIVVTHLPQIAAAADQHFVVEKTVHDGQETVATVNAVADEQRVTEIVRMMGVEQSSDAGQDVARQMLRQFTQ